MIRDIRISRNAVNIVLFLSKIDCNNEDTIPTTHKPTNYSLFLKILLQSNTLRVHDLLRVRFRAFQAGAVILAVYVHVDFRSYTNLASGHV